MQRMCELLSALSEQTLVSGREQGADTVFKLLSPLADSVRQTVGGSIVAVKKSGFSGTKKVMIDVHLDEVSLMVSKIDENGFVHFINHAGVDEKILPGAKVTILSKEKVEGVVAAKPPHLLTDEERKKPMKMKEMVIDIGLSAEQAKQTVKVGDTIALHGAFRKLLNHTVTGKSLDNRACVATLISFLEQIQTRPLYADLYIVFSSGEEFGGFGATASALEISPDYAIVLDVSHADMPTAKSWECGKLGGGWMLGISPVLDAPLTERLRRTAEEYKIPYQTEVMAGRTYTNSDNITSLCGGIPTALLSIPLRYMHTPQEVVSLEDMASLRTMLLAFFGKAVG